MGISPRRHGRPTDTMKSCAASPIVREMQAKATASCHLTPVRWAVIKRTGTRQDAERNPRDSRGVNWCRHVGQQRGLGRGWSRRW